MGLPGEGFLEEGGPAQWVWRLSGHVHNVEGKARALGHPPPRSRVRSEAGADPEGLLSASEQKTERSRLDSSHVSGL